MSQAQITETFTLENLLDRFMHCQHMFFKVFCVFHFVCHVLLQLRLAYGTAFVGGADEFPSTG